MASRLKFDSDRREMRRERHEERVARKRERQQARELKQAQHVDVVGVRRGAIERSVRVAVLEPVPSAAVSMPEPENAAVATVPAAASSASTEERKPFVPQRERDVAAFLARREEVIAAARVEAQERIERMGEDRAVADALGALAHSGAAPWRRHREQLAEAITTGGIPRVGACARRACRGAASDAARTSHRAPDPELALAVAVAYAVIGLAPWAAVRGARAERSNPMTAGARRPFWR
jgi:hypothetical protein